MQMTHFIVHSVRATLKKWTRQNQEQLLSNKEIHVDIVYTLGEDSPCCFTVKKWVADFKLGRESTDDDARTGRPKISYRRCPGGKDSSYGDE